MPRSVTPGVRRPRPGPAEAGQATAELALLLPVVVALALGLFQAALVVRDELLVSHVARDAARLVSVGTDPAEVRERVDRSLPGARVSIERGRDVGDPVAVAISFESRTTLPVIGPLFPDVVLDARVEMRAERTGP